MRLIILATTFFLGCSTDKQTRNGGDTGFSTETDSDTDTGSDGGSSDTDSGDTDSSDTDSSDSDAYNTSDPCSVRPEGAELDVGLPTFEDESEDGIWQAGEHLTFSISLMNCSASDHMNYPGVWLDGNREQVPNLPNDGFWFFGILSGEYLEAVFTWTAADNLPNGTEITFTAKPSTLNCIQDGTSCPVDYPYEFTLVIGEPLP